MVRRRAEPRAPVEICGFAEDEGVQLWLDDDRRGARVPIRHEPPAVDGVVELAGPDLFDAPVVLEVAGAPDRSIAVRVDGGVEALIVVTPWQGEPKAKPQCTADPWAISITARGLTVDGVRRFAGLWPGRYVVYASFEGRRDCDVVDLAERDGDLELDVGGDGPTESIGPK